MSLLVVVALLGCEDSNEGVPPFQGGDARVVLDAPPADAGRDGPPPPCGPGGGGGGTSGTPISITHSDAPTVVTAGNSIQCDEGAANASFYRVFVLENFGIEALVPTHVTAGVEGTRTQPQPIGARVYGLDGELRHENMTLIAYQDLPVTQTTATGLVEFELEYVDDSPPLPPVLVVEVAVPGGTGYNLRAGSNFLGQSSPTYYRATACGVDEPTDAVDLGFPEMHLVVSLTGLTQ